MADRKSCDLCPKAFALYSGGFYAHRQSHSGGKRYNCPQCNKSFGRADHLKTHSLIHTEEKPHKCTQCNYSANKIISAMNAPLLQLHRVLWSSTKGPTLGKNLTDAQCASFPAFKQMNWKFTWWGSIQEKSHSSVTNATTLALLLVICRATWGHTLGKSLSGATNVAKLMDERAFKL